MTNEPVFRGVATALITPLNESGIDFESFGRLIDWQIEEGINAIVIAGTTGEGSTLTDEEHRAAIDFSVQRAAGRVPIIAGTGSNDTAYAVDLTRAACQMGADAMLVVSPYYNKTTQKGLIRMYETIADASTKPLILYNVPSRTGVNIEPTTYAALADHPMIAGIKEANSNIAKIGETMALVGGKLDLYSGNDDQIVPLLACGGKGVICYKLNEKTGKLIGAKAVKEGQDILLITNQGIIIRTMCDQISVQGRSASGVKVFNVGDNEDVVVASIARVRDDVPRETFGAANEEASEEEKKAEAEKAEEEAFDDEVMEKLLERAEEDASEDETTEE